MDTSFLDTDNTEDTEKTFKSSSLFSLLSVSQKGSSLFIFITGGAGISLVEPGLSLSKGSRWSVYRNQRKADEHTCAA